MFVNLTPHVVRIVLPEGEISFPPSGIVARVAEIPKKVNTFNGIDIYSVRYGEVENLPAPEEGVIYIVSAVVRAAAPFRKDLASPYGLVRDSQGNVIGAKGLQM